MHYLEETTGIQKLLIILFIATICLSCLSLLGIANEKPDKIITHCERQGLYSMKPVVLNLSNISNGNNGLSLVPNCTTIINPPMSNSLSLLINITTVCAGIFIVAAILVYITRKKEINDEPPAQ